MAGKIPTPKTPKPAAPPAAKTSSWKDKFKYYFNSNGKSAPSKTDVTKDKTESKSVLSKIKDNTKDNKIKTETGIPENELYDSFDSNKSIKQLDNNDILLNNLVLSEDYSSDRDLYNKKLLNSLHYKH